MDIIFVTHRNPWPPRKGTQLRPYHMVRHLAERGHRVHLFGFLDDGDPAAAQLALSEFCASVHLEPLHDLRAKVQAALSPLTQRSPSEAYFYSRGLAQAIQSRLAQSPIAAMAGFSSTMAQYMPSSLWRATVLDLCDLDSVKWAALAQQTSGPMRWVYRLEAQRLARTEQRCLENFGACVLATGKELALFQERLPASVPQAVRQRLHAISNGTDVDYFDPAAMAQFSPAQLPIGEQAHFASTESSQATGPNLVFTGAMDYAPNVEAVVGFVQSCWPQIRERHPQARFLIVGSKPTAAVTSLAQVAGVVVTGFVEDVRPYLHVADVVVVPLQLARGIQNKALEAMAFGKPVVMTSSVASGIDHLPTEAALGAEHAACWVADDPAAFSSACLDLIAQPERAQRLGQNARAFVMQHYRWQPLMDRFANLLEAQASADR